MARGRFALAIVLVAGLSLSAPARAKITFDFDYTYDSNNFFNPNTANGQAARAALLTAGHVYEDRLLDNLSAITPGGGNTWTAAFFSPSTGASVSILDLPIPTGVIKVYVGGRSLGGAVGLGGPGGYSNGNGDTAFRAALQYRGQTGASLSPPTDVGPWGGSIAFDNSVAWNFNLGGPANNKNDFLTIATHEIAHVLGFGTAGSTAVNGSWVARLTLSGGKYVGPFTGPKAMALYGGPVPLETLDPTQTVAAHFKPGLMSTVGGVTAQETLMDPDITVGTRKKITLLDWAALDDVGWDLARPGDANADGTVDFNDLVLLAQNYGAADGQHRWSQGDFNYDGNVNFNDLTLLAQNYNTSGPLASETPEGTAPFDVAWSSALALAAGEAPEPGALALACLGLLFAGRSGRYRASAAKNRA